MARCELGLRLCKKMFVIVFIPRFRGLLVRSSERWIENSINSYWISYKRFSVSSSAPGTSDVKFLIATLWEYGNAKTKCRSAWNLYYHIRLWKIRINNIEEISDFTGATLWYFCKNKECGSDCFACCQLHFTILWSAKSLEDEDWSDKGKKICVGSGKHCESMNLSIDNNEPEFSLI